MPPAHIDHPFQSKGNLPQGKYLAPLFWAYSDPVADRASNESLHGIFIEAIQLQVAVFFVTLQNTLVFKKPGYSVTDRVDQFGQFLLIYGYGALESCLSLLVYFVYFIQKQHVEMYIQIRRTTKPLNERDCTGFRCFPCLLCL